LVSSLDLKNEHINPFHWLHFGNSRNISSNKVYLYSYFLVLVGMSTVHSMFGFNLSLAKIEVGIAYAVWSAIGTTIVTTVGIVVFRESCDLWKISCLVLILAGVVGLNLRE